MNNNNQKKLNNNIRRISKKFNNRKLNSNELNKILNNNLNRVKMTKLKTKKKNNAGMHSIMNTPAQLLLTNYLADNNLGRLRKTGLKYRNYLDINFRNREKKHKIRKEQEKERRELEMIKKYAEKLFYKMLTEDDEFITIRDLKDFLGRIYNISFDGTIFDLGKNDDDLIEAQEFEHLFLTWIRQTTY